MSGKKANAFACVIILITACLGTFGLLGSDGQAQDEPGDDPPVPLANPELPGIVTPSEELTNSLWRAFTDRGSDYEPRAEHREDDGRPFFVNRLIQESSPYLLQHAHNPVNWFPWGTEAFEMAAALGRPILLSVGYSTCHWCHVMEHESFEDLEIAAFINANFIPIKVDREERPDVDGVYMTAVNLLTGRGGWPMTVVMTPEGQPFFGGTYFPARDGDRGTRMGFLSILHELDTLYREHPDEAVQQAEDLTQQITARSQPARPGTVPGPELLESLAHALADRFDHDHGGFGRAPKFPRTVTHTFLMRYYRRTGDEAALQIVTETLGHMLSGGIYDQIGGGFHRYATDQRWLVPHFEKMLYDNAQLVSTYLAAYQITGDEPFRRIATETLDYVAREMTDAVGGFYSATDADSPTPDGHQEEGLFHTWTPEELEAVLGAHRAGIVEAFYGVTDRGNFEGRNILYRPRTAETVAIQFAATGSYPGIDVPTLMAEVEAARQLLYDARDERLPPGLDDKLLVAWNGLMISAFAQGAFVLGETSYLERAQVAADFVLETMRDEDGRLARSWTHGQLGPMAYLEDYAFFVQGLLDLFEASGESRWLEEAIVLQALLDEHYWDESAGGYFLTADDAEALLIREKPSYDGAEPAGNSVAVLNLLRLYELTFDSAYRERSEEALGAFAGQLRRSAGLSLPLLAAGLDFYLDRPREVVIVLPDGGYSALDDPLVTVLRESYLPNRAVVVSNISSLTAMVDLVPVLEGKVLQDGVATAYVCEEGRCELPTSDPAVFREQLERVVPLYEDRSPIQIDLGD